MNVLKVITPEEAKELANMYNKGVKAGIVKDIFERINRLAKIGCYECTIVSVPDAYISYIQSLGYSVNRLTDNMIQVSWE